MWADASGSVGTEEARAAEREALRRMIEERQDAWVGREGEVFVPTLDDAADTGMALVLASENGDTEPIDGDADGN